MSRKRDAGGNGADTRADRLSLLFWLLRAIGVLGAFGSGAFYLGFIVLASAAESYPAIGVRPLFAELPETEAVRLLWGLLLTAIAEIAAGLLYLMGYFAVAFVGLGAAALIALTTGGHPWWLPPALLALIALLSIPLRARAAAAQIARESLLRPPRNR